MQLDSLIDALEEALKQEHRLIAALTPEQYRAPASGRFKSGVGMHIRHNLDHFEAFFAGLECGEIDFESRSRSGQIEAIPELAITAIDRYLDGLEGLRGVADATVQVREESDVGVRERRWLSSSVGREMQFLLGHTVHHHAIIGMIVDLHGLELPDGFGVAPSTQRHQAGCEPVES